MAWETRPNSTGRYFTRSQRVGGRIFREYVGAEGSPTAQLAAAEAVLRQEHRERERAERRTERERLAALDAPVLALGALSDALLGATLVAGGYRQHDRGDWRRRRAHAG